MKKPPTATVTVFADNKGTRIVKAEGMSLSDVEQMIRTVKPRSSKDGLQLLKYAEFGNQRTEGGSLRSNANVIAVTGIEGDCDDGVTPMATAVDLLKGAGISALFHTTSGHEPGGVGRWRVLCPLGTPITDDLDKEHRYWVGVLNSYLGGVLGGESFKLSQTYYFGRITGRADPEIITVAGKCIDEVRRHPAPVFGEGEPDGKTRSPESQYQGQLLSPSQLAWVLNAVRSDDEYHRWLPVGQILKTDYDDFDLWLQWSKDGKKFESENVCRYKWGTFNGKGLTTGTLVHWAGGWSKIPKPLPEEEFDEWVDDLLDDAPKAREDLIPIFDVAEFLKRPRPHWRIKNLLPETGLALIFGASGSGKTFFTLDLVGAILAGGRWGRDGLMVRQGRAVYVAAEGPGGFLNRLEALRQDGRHLAGLKIIPSTPLITTDKAADKLIATLKSIGGTDVLVLDTLSQVTAGLDENSAEMSHALRAAGRLQLEFGCLVIFIGHSGKDPTKGHRGWTGVFAAVDTAVEVTQVEEIRTATVTKQRDGETSLAYSFILRPVIIDTDSDGDAITTCLLDHCDTPTTAPKASQPSGHNQKIVYQVFKACVGPDGTADEQIVTSQSATKLPRGEGRNRQREHARQALNGLVDRKVLVREGGLLRAHP